MVCFFANYYFFHCSNWVDYLPSYSKLDGYFKSFLLKVKTLAHNWWSLECRWLSIWKRIKHACLVMWCWVPSALGYSSSPHLTTNTILYSRKLLSKTKKRILKRSHLFANSATMITSLSGQGNSLSYGLQILQLGITTAWSSVGLVVLVMWNRALLPRLPSSEVDCRKQIRNVWETKINLTLTKSFGNGATRLYLASDIQTKNFQNTSLILQHMRGGFK